MPLAKSFTKPTTAPGSRWAGIPSAMPKTPMLNIGHEYDVELVSFEETRNPGTGTESFKVTLKVVEGDDPHFKAGSQAVCIYMKHGKSLEMGMSKLKATAVAFAGCATDEEYDERDPSGALIDNTFNNVGDNLIGEKAHVVVTQGSAIKGKPGEFYQEYDWSPIGA